MSFKGNVKAQCPKGCETFDADVWSFVRGEDIRLREGLLAGDLNLLICPECGAYFYPESTLIYYDAPAELLVFILPEAYKAEEAMWREKIKKDYVQMKEVIAGDVMIKEVPVIYFGLEAFRAMLQAEDDIEDEVRIAQFIGREIGLALQHVERAFAREKDLPRLIPYVKTAKQPALSRMNMVEGLKKLLAANDRLQGYRRWLKYIESNPALPPLKGKEEKKS